MKKIEQLGDWILNNWWMIAPMIAITVLTASICLLPKSVRLSEREFKCVESEPDGLDTRCVTYTRRVR